MEPAIKFFLDRARLNYTFALFLFLAGIYSWNILPKEIFPPFELDKLMISGAYSGASADTLDKMAVTDIEDEVKSISGITKVDSTIRSGVFNMILTLEKNSDKTDIYNKVKDAVSTVIPNLPSDMTDPSVTSMTHKFPLMQVSISSEKLNKEELLNVAKEIKSKLARIENLTDIAIYGESDTEVKIRLDSRKIEAYALDNKSVISAIAGISYIFPLGKIEQQGEHLFMTTTFGKGSQEEYLNTLLTIGNKRIYLRDIAHVQIEHGDSDTRSTFDGHPSFTMNLSKDAEGNAITLAKDVKNLLKQYEQEEVDVVIESFSDTSIYIRNRLNTVTSNIFFGFILVTLSMFLLINKRISIVVAAGIPFSFIIGLIFFQFTGYSINMMSLLGALIAIGVLVDDAIIVAENIQRHIEEGMPPREAAIVGTKEVAMPVIMATLTTMFAFMPMLMMEGEMGQFIKMIPVAVIILILASLVESFFFLPLHSRHLLRPHTPTLSWNPMQQRYINFLRRLIHHKRLSLAFFLVFIPAMTVFGFMHSKFQFFPSFDSTEIYITGKLNINNSIDDTFESVKKIEQEVLKHKDELYLDHTSAVAGFKFEQSTGGENGDHVFSIFVPLKEPIEDNFIERYITPVLTFDFDRSDRIRPMKSFEVETKLREYLKEIPKTYHTEEFSVDAARAGLIQWDIDIALLSNSGEKIRMAIDELQNAMKKIEGVTKVSDDAKEGVREIKLKINRYGEQLGLNEGTIASLLSDYFLFAKRAQSFDSEGIVEIKTEDINKDRITTLENFTIALSDGGKVQLKDVVELEYTNTYEKIIKKDGEREKSVFANVDPKIVTSLEVLKKLEPIFEKLRSEGITINLGGEQEKNEQLMHDMMVASTIALFLMFLALLFMFDSFKHALMILSIIPFSFLGVVAGHHIMGMNLTMPSIIGILGLAGVVINDGIVMLSFIRNTHEPEMLFKRASQRLRPVVLTSITTLLGLSTLIFFPSGQAKILQPLAIALGFGLAWGTVLNLIYLPTLYAVVNRVHKVNTHEKTGQKRFGLRTNWLKGSKSR